MRKRDIKRFKLELDIGKIPEKCSFAYCLLWGERIDMFLIRKCQIYNKRFGGECSSCPNRIFVSGVISKQRNKIPV